MKNFLSLFKRKKQITHSEIENFEEPKLNIKLTEKKDINLILGDKIIEVNTHLELRKVDNWLDTSIAFIELEKNGVICFPYSGDENFENQIVEANSKPILDKFQKLIYNQKIEDIFYPLDDESNEFDEMKFGYLLLENGYVLEENRMSPSGTGQADMFCKTLAEFEKEIAENEIKIYSVKYKTQKYSS